MTGFSRFRSRWLSARVARWVTLGAAVPALWACTARKLEEPIPAPARVFNDTFQQSVNRDLDIVFLVDNSLSMQPLQAQLVANFPAFMNVLKALPLPNVHIAVISSDLGAGPETGITRCRPGGDQGVFQFAPRGTCTASTLQAGQTYIQNNGAGTANYDTNKDIADVFTCIAALGDQGCGFEHQFASMLRALGADGFAAPMENAGFLRPNAFLSVILITNEDDCSAPPDTDLFSASSKYVSDPLGPLTSYRCNEFGHTCNGARPPRTADTLTGTCQSTEDGRLLKVADAVSRLKALKTDTTKVLVAAIAGPPDPYVVTTVAPTVPDDPSLWPNIGHSCINAKNPMAYADPSVRIKQWIDGFGTNGLFLPICEDSFAPALDQIAKEIGKKIGAPCVEGRAVYKTAADGMKHYDCAVIDHTFSDQGVKIDTTVPSCLDNGNAPPCWTISVNAGSCPLSEHLLVSFNRGAGPAPTTELNSTVACSVCVKADDPRCQQQ